MHIQYFVNQSTQRLYPLGIHENDAYFYVDTVGSLDFVTIDVRFPNNWHKIGQFSREDVSYGFPALSPDANFIFVLFLKMSDDCVFGVKRIYLKTGREDEFSYSGDWTQVFQINFERVTLRSGDHGELVLYDRTIVQGTLPFWNIRLDEDSRTFAVRYNPINTNGEPATGNLEKACLFNVAVDPVNRIFAKLMSPREMLVHTGTQEKWVRYTVPSQDSLIDVFGTDGFPVEETKRLHETYGSHGHRIGAMQTRLTFHDSNGTVVARFVHNNKKCTTAVVEFDHTHHEILVRKLATFHLHDEVSRMFYLIATPEIHVFLGVRHSSVVYVRPRSLEEIAGLRMQKMLKEDGFYEEVSGIADSQGLLKLCYEKYLMTEDLKNLELNQDNL
ncbi:unnamed protein product [Caenorhabditis nigoni]